MLQYRVLDLLTNTIDPQTFEVRASTPERAAEKALGVSLIRSGSKRDLRARVYSQIAGQPMTMVRLYGRAADRVST